MRPAKLLRAAAVAAAITVAPTAAVAQNCGGFTDVFTSDNYCNAVEWLKNRQVTLGCTSTTVYCPGDVVSRGSMALFMQRLGNVITPKWVSFQQGTGTGSTIQPGQFQGVCSTPSQALPAVNYPQSLRIRGTVSAPFGAGTIALAMYYQLNNGPFVNLNSTELQVSVPSGDHVLHWSSNVVLVPPGNAISGTIAIVNRGLAPLSLFTNGRCAIEVETTSAVTTTPPFDAR